MPFRLDRRAFLGGVATSFLARSARADFTRFVGGRLAFRVPWLLRSVDPHRLDDPMAQLFGAALFDALYTVRTERHLVVPALAAGAPELSGEGYEVRLRSGIVTALGKRIVASDVVSSIERSRALAGTSWLQALGPIVASDAATIRFPKPLTKATAEFAKVALPKLLSSPLLAVLPPGYNPAAPDGTGPFRLEIGPDGFHLVRNANAVLGVSVLDEIVVGSASDLSSSLRAFESGTDDLGWLGLGLYGNREGASRFEGSSLGDVVLLTGTKAPLWDVPGVAQEIANGIDANVLRPFVPNALPAQGVPQKWGAGAVELFSRADPWLLELARAVAGAISKPGHPVSVHVWSDEERRARLKDRAFPIAIDFVRSFHDPKLAAGARAHALVSRYSKDRIRELADPFVAQDPRLLSRSHRFGLLAAASAEGGVAKNVYLPTSNGIEWGLVARGTP